MMSMMMLMMMLLMINCSWIVVDDYVGDLRKMHQPRSVLNEGLPHAQLLETDASLSTSSETHSMESPFSLFTKAKQGIILCL